MFRIDEYPCRISQASLVSFDDSGRSDVATLISRPRENKDRLIDVVRNVQVAGLGIHGEVAGPIQLGPVTLNHAQWRRIAGRVQRINRNRRRIERGRAEVPRLVHLVSTTSVHDFGAIETHRLTPIRDEQQPVLCINSDTVRRLESRVIAFYHSNRLLIASHGRSLVIGDLVTPSARAELAETIRDALKRWRDALNPAVAAPDQRPSTSFNP